MLFGRVVRVCRKFAQRMKAAASTLMHALKKGSDTSNPQMARPAEKTSKLQAPKKNNRPKPTKLDTAYQLDQKIAKAIQATRHINCQSHCQGVQTPKHHILSWQPKVMRPSAPLPCKRVSMPARHRTR